MGPYGNRVPYILASVSQRTNLQMDAKSTARKLAYKTFSTFWPKTCLPQVIYYHSVHPDHNLPRRLSPDRFLAQMQWLQNNHYDICTLSQLAQRVYSGTATRKSVAVTFDDGYLDNYEIALPILLDHQMKATFFVITNMIGDLPKSSDEGKRLCPSRHMMTKQQLREMHNSGMEIGSHTRTHIHVRDELRRSYDAAWNELAGSRQALEDMLGSEVRTFCYPNGQKGVFDEATKKLLQDAGYYYAATTIWGAFDHQTDPLEIPRIRIRPDDSLVDFEKKLSGQYDFIRWIHQSRDGSRNWAETE